MMMENEFSAVSEVDRLREENEALRDEIIHLKQRRITKEEAKLLRDIQKCKIELKKQSLTKSGYNSHNKYSYFELDDFLSCVEIILNKRGLASFFWFEDDIAELTICNEEGTSHTWITKCVPAKAKENGYDVGVHMKSEQAVQTYARRTLWLQAMEITEPNAIESDGKEKPSTNNRQFKQKKKVTADKVIKPIREKKEKEVSAEEIQNIIKIAHIDFDKDQQDLPDKDKKEWNWENAKQYIRMYCNNENTFNICKQSLEFKTADQI